MYQSSLPPSDAPEPLLPVNGPADLSQPVTLPVVPAANQTGDTQQVLLIQALGRFNTQTDELLQQQPNLETVYQQQLAALFPELQRPINPNHIFYSRYREDVPGQKQWLGSDPLGSLLARLRGPDAQAYLTQESGAFYRESGTVDEAKRLSAASPTATLAGVLEIAFTVKLNEFWRDREGDQPTLEERLVDLRRQVLAHQLALRTLDGTLSAASRTLADTVLKYPTAAARKKVFPTGPRPAVYRLALDNGSEFAAAFILNATGGTPPVGNILLFSPGEGFEEFENLARLNETVAARVRASDPAGQRLIASLPLAAQAHASDTPILASDPPRIEADVIADHVRSLRVRQYFNTRAALRQQTLPLAGELALVADLAPHLDVSAALAARNLRLVAPHDPVWLSTASPADQQLYRQLETTLVDNNEALRPLLEQISTLPAFAEDETRKVLSRQKPEYANVDLDVHKSLVRLRVSTSMPVKVTGYRDDESETVYICEDPQLDIPLVLTEQTLTFGTWNVKEVVDLRTLGSYARRNIDAWSPHELHRTITATADLFDTRGEKVGRLDNADLRALALQADIGQQYAAYLRAAFAPDGEGRAFASAWQRANAARMRKDALESRLNPAVNDLFIFKTPGGGLDWVQAVAQHPDPTTRPKVGQFDIEVNLLVMGGGLEGGQGGQVINGVLVIQRKGTRPGGVCVLYTPEAPDDAPFRELVLGLAELDTLKAKPEWRAYFSQRMATHDVRELSRVFNDTRSVHRYALTPVTGELHAYLYSAQLGFQLSHADYRSRTNAEIALESAVNGFLFSVEVADFLLGLSLFKALRRLAHRYIVRGVRNAQKLGRSIPGLIRKIGEDKKASIVLAKPSIRPLDPAWVDVAEYRLPHSIDALFDVEAFAQTHHFRLSRAMGALSFMDSRNQHFVAMMGNDGRYYLYASHVEEGARFIKHPTGNKPDFMVVPGDAKSWKPRFERTTRGGGSVLGVLGGRTAEQQVHDDLIAAMRIYFSATHGEAMLKEVTVSQKRRLLDNALERLSVDEATFRRIVWGQRGVPAPRLRETLLNIEFEANLYTHLNKTTYFLSGQFTLSSEEMENLFIKIKRIVGRNDDFSKHVVASISIIDHDTGATFVGYAFTQKQLNSLTKFDNKFHLSTWRQETLEAFVREKGRTKIVQDIATQHNISFNEALKKLLEAQSIQEALETFRIERRREFLLKLGVDSFSDDFKKAGIPYIVLSHGERTGAVSSFKAVDSVTVAEFERTIPKFSTPLEFQPAHPPLPRGERLPQRPQPPVPPSPVTPSGDGAAHIVRFDELMETQLSLLPANAKSKIDEIVQDIQGGRVSGKKIGSYSYVDLPQLDPGAGRGRWRVALEKTGKDGEKDVYVLRGIIDYHGSRRKTWGL